MFSLMRRALHVATPRAVAAALAVAHGLPSAAGCGPTAEEQDMLAFVKTAGGNDEHYNELRAIGLGTPLLCLAYNGGAFKAEIPRASDFTALLHSLHASTAITGADAWADPTTTDAAGMRTHLAQTQMLAQVFMACRAVEKVHMARFCKVAGVSTGDVAEEEPVTGKKADVEAERLITLASALYNFDFTRDGSMSTEAVLRTRNALRLNRFELSPLRSTHYGAMKPATTTTRKLVPGPGGVLVEQEEELTLTRSGSATR